MTLRAPKFLLLLALPLGALAANPYQEKGPRTIKQYLDDGAIPNYIRVDMAGTYIRNTPSFARDDLSNVDFAAKGGDLFAVESVKPGEKGAAVQIHVDDDLRWVYVPYGPDGDKNFQLCESEACFSAMARSLDYLLKGSGVSVEAAQACGISAGPEGIVIPRGAASPAPRPAPAPPVRPRPAVTSAPVASNGNFRMRVKPLWESARGAQGENWTRLMSSAIDKYGQGLLRQRTLSDAATFCPRFSQLNQDEKKEFWIHLFAGIARYESNFKPGAPAFDESRHVDVFHGHINAGNYSMGLFQLSYGSVSYGKGCQMDYERDRYKDVSDPSLTIYDAKIQTECAVTVMNQWVSRDGGIGLSDTRGGARFWSTLRSKNPATQNVIATLHRDTACFK